MSLSAFVTKLLSRAAPVARAREHDGIPAGTTFVRDGQRLRVLSHHNDEVVVQDQNGNLLSLDEASIRTHLREEADAELLALFDAAPSESIEELMDQLLQIKPHHLDENGRPVFIQSLETYSKLLAYGTKVPLYYVEWWTRRARDLDDGLFGPLARALALSHDELSTFLLQKCGEAATSATYTFQFSCTGQLALVRLLDGPMSAPQEFEMLTVGEAWAGDWTAEMHVDFAEYNAYDPSVGVRRVVLEAKAGEGTSELELEVELDSWDIGWAICHPDAAVEVISRLRDKCAMPHRLAAESFSIESLGRTSARVEQRGGKLARIELGFSFDDDDDAGE